MTTKALTLTDFLLARIAEDEAVARAMPFEPEWTSHPDETGQPIRAGRSRIATCADSVMSHIARHDPARVLAECEAKRRIVDMHGYAEARGYGDPIPVCLECGPWEDVMFRVGIAGNYPCPTLRAIAAVYADHSDYRDEWRV